MLYWSLVAANVVLAVISIREIGRMKKLNKDINRVTVETLNVLASIRHSAFFEERVHHKINRTIDL